MAGTGALIDAGTLFVPIDGMISHAVSVAGWIKNAMLQLGTASPALSMAESSRSLMRPVRGTRVSSAQSSRTKTHIWI